MYTQELYPHTRTFGRWLLTWHALATYNGDGGERAALVLKTGLYDLGDVGRCVQTQGPWHDASVGDLLDTWAAVAPSLAALADAVDATPDVVAMLDPATPLAMPFHPKRIFGAASNFIEHANEMGTVLAAKADSMPYMFMKAETSAIGPHDEIVLPNWSKQVDWEVELTAVIGRGGRDISVDDALHHVAAYTVMNDVSARDLGRRTDFPFKQDWFRQKSFDSFGPFGPWLVPASLVPDPQAVGLRLLVNDEVMQDGTTAEMIFTVAEQIAYLSRVLALKPGDLIMTGTPTGVGMGRGVFLKAGDVVTALVEGIGALRNPVVA